MLILVRHGRTDLNRAGRLQGRVDAPLDELGRAQAAAMARALGSLGPGVRVVSSPLQRARDTAAALGLPVTVDERWLEIDYGDWDGLPLGEVPREAWAGWRQDPAFAPPGGESLVTLGQRVQAACDDLADAAAEHDVVVVSHVSPIKAAVSWTLGAGPELAWRLFLAPASITRVATAGPLPSLQGYNDTAHLAGVVDGVDPTASAP